MADQASQLRRTKAADSWTSLILLLPHCSVRVMIQRFGGDVQVDGDAVLLVLVSAKTRAVLCGAKVVIATQHTWRAGVRLAAIRRPRMTASGRKQPSQTPN